MKIINHIRRIVPILLLVTAAVRLSAQEKGQRAGEGVHKSIESSLSVRANLMRWATLTPDIGIEWHIDGKWGILLNGSYTSWRWNGKNRRYALWETTPELRYYLGEKRRGYIGAMFKTGSFNYKFSTFGKQGDIIGGGITGGYKMKLNDTLDLDFSLGLGCLHADYEKYTIINDVRVRRENGSRNWLGPTSAGVTLVWVIF